MSNKTMIQLPSNNDKILSPMPAELVTLPSHMACHDHSYTQIVIGLKGQAEFEVNGYGNLVGPGQGCVVTSGSDHAFGGVIGQSDILVLNMPAPNAEDPLVLERLNALNQSDVYFQLDNQIQKLIQMLVAEMQASPNDHLLSRACNDTVMALLHRHISALHISRKESRFDLEAIDRYIERHITYKISVAQLAGSVFLGESQFHALFKEQLGITPHQYVLGKRIDMAKRLIEQGHITLGQVAELSGFSGQSTFTHSFTRLQGISPSQYKKQLSY
ncbi:AraC family transcriptional regulator [Vibrio renipiscarius]|uniref:AraC family transcriptional regulator n=1 Tax=Vibrio renipiscarius TaxID=1461322 RepID=A0A0C2NF41_9VIBR|nr:AraC family transcriptional regulator [Vibrio renipiscarius]KII76277.1 AraC family transcriptional regulator [Vibrio renipiscarius]KII78201.1 AraC family transcriptional regulator [Vibrio renipiscarius]